MAFDTIRDLFTGEETPVHDPIDFREEPQEAQDPRQGELPL